MSFANVDQLLDHDSPVLTRQLGDASIRAPGTARKMTVRADYERPLAVTHIALEAQRLDALVGSILP